MCDPKDKKEDVGSILEDIWEKVSKSVEEGLRVGKDEIVRTAKVGKIRLAIASLKSNKNEKIKLLGMRTYGLLQSGEIKISQLDELLREIKEVDLHIDTKEEEIQFLMAEKAEEEGEETSEAEVMEAEVVSPEKEELAPKPKPAEKKTTRKKKTTSTAKTSKKTEK